MRWFVARHRRSLAAVCAGLAVFCVLLAVRPAPARDAVAATPAGTATGAAGIPPGQAAVALHLADAGAAAALRPGDLIDVFAVPADPRTPTNTVATNVVVRTVVAASQEGSPAFITVLAPSNVAPILARASVDERLAVTVH